LLSEVMRREKKQGTAKTLSMVTGKDRRVDQNRRDRGSRGRTLDRTSMRKDEHHHVSPAYTEESCLTTEVKEIRGVREVHH